MSIDFGMVGPDPWFDAPVRSDGRSPGVNDVAEPDGDRSVAEGPPSVPYEGLILSFDPRWAERFHSIDWLARCGERDLRWSRRARPVRSPGEASERGESIEWENLLLERQNDLTVYLHDHHPGAYRSWNDLVRWARTTVLVPLTPTLERAAASVGLGAGAAPLIRFGLCTVMMAQAYGPLVPDEVRLDLLPVYEAGHLPCGWHGNYPRGRLLYW